MSQCTITVHWLYNSVHSTIAMLYYYYKNNPAFKEIGVSTYVHPSVIGLFQIKTVVFPFHNFLCLPVMKIKLCTFKVLLKFKIDLATI